MPDEAVLLAEASEVARFIEPLGLRRGECERGLESQPLVLALMIERTRGAQSAWAPYLDFLPAAWPHMPFAWPVRSTRCHWLANVPAAAPSACHGPDLV